MAQIFPVDFEEKNTIAQGDFILFSDSEDGDKIKKAQYSNLKGEPGNAATVCVGSTTTGAAGTCACVTNSGDCYNAVLNFTIPKGDKGDTGQTGPAIVCAEFNGDDIDFTEEDGNVVVLSGAKTCLKGDTGTPGAAATVSIGTTTTLDAGCCATVSNSGTSSAAVFNFGIPKGDKGDTGETGCTGPAGNGIACVTSTKAGKITTVDITCTDGCSYCFNVCDGEDGQGAGDVLGPASSTDGDVVLFDGNTGKLIKDSGKTLPGVCNSLSCSSTTDALSAKQGCVLNSCVSAINGKIPSAATCSNQLADKDYVNDSINSVTAYYITKNAQGDQFACYAELAAATTFYSGGVARTPTRNDYTIVADDECYNDATTRYLYNSGWEFQYCINESPMTTAQVNAINSGITSAKVTCYDSCMAQCCDIPTDNCQLSNGCGYVTSAAIPTNNCQLANGCGYTTCVGTITGICMNGASCGTSGVIDLGNTGSTACYVDFVMVGGGGGGGFGGGAGGQVNQQYRAEIGKCNCVTIGTGGTATAGGNGNAGGYSRICNTCGMYYVALGGCGNVGCDGGEGTWHGGCGISSTCKAGGGGSGAGCPGKPYGYCEVSSRYCGPYRARNGGAGGAGVMIYGFCASPFGIGGGGGGCSNCTGGGCACDGGGAGGINTGTAGTANTGGGGGGGGASGGSGVAFIRYPSNGCYGFTTATGGNSCYTVTEGGTTYCVHKFTSSGKFCITG